MSGSMKKFLTMTAILEALTGIALIAFPRIIVLFLLGIQIDGPGPAITAMIAGVAILSLAAICWLLRDTENSQKLVKGMLFYNFLIIAVSLFGMFSYHLAGIGLWLIICAHSGLSLWGVLTLRTS
jgi:hypothetical protein